MRVREDTPDRLVLTMVPWETWILATLAGPAFMAMALFQPFVMSGWAAVFFFFLGAVAFVAFLAGHAAVRAEFHRPDGTVTITQTRPIGGTSRNVIALAEIEAVDTIVQTDSDDTEHHQIVLVLRRGTRSVALTSMPLLQDQTALANRLAHWLGVPMHG